eukprot:TRINITY_DN8829_c0_g1_i1.p1 TRINITY_DN8829_c0_g1~~TRINITY_DN8829_c0_g1_i1.p1  ORF type:complete len:144 (+),score=23.81 TRINITY_DN8829_c0_g1_i1:178-609(+)
MAIKREVFSIGSGILFGLGWWILVDGAVYSTFKQDFGIEWYLYMPAVVATLALMMINVVSLEDMSASSLFSEGVEKTVRVWLFFSFTVAFGACAAMLVFVALSLFDSTYAAVTFCVQPIVVFISALFLLYSRKTSDEDEFMAY